MKYCVKCGTALDDDAEFCSKCGASQKSKEPEKQKNYSSWDSISSETAKAPVPTVEDRNSRKGRGIASLVLGLVGLVCFGISWAVAAIPLSIVCFVCGIIGLILGAQCLNKQFGNSVGVAGFILSIISSVGGIIVFIIMMIYLQR